MRPGALLKLKLAEVLLREMDPILCASIGRVASTRVAQTLVRERSKAIFGFCRYVSRTFIREPAWDLKGVRFRPGAVYKTHDFPYDLIAPPRLKIVFLYGRPSDSVLSLVRCYESKGPAWMERHFAHMHADGSYGELFQRDVLRIGEQIEAWSGVRNANVLGIRYSALWDKIEILNRFVGFDVRLPPWIERNFMDINPAIVAIVRENYRELDMKEADLPDHFLSSRSPGER
jgi:hypothetical protein